MAEVTKKSIFDDNKRVNENNTAEVLSKYCSVIYSELSDLKATVKQVISIKEQAAKKAGVTEAHQQLKITQDLETLRDKILPSIDKALQGVLALSNDLRFYLPQSMQEQPNLGLGSRNTAIYNDDKEEE